MKLSSYLLVLSLLVTDLACKKNKPAETPEEIPAEPDTTTTTIPEPNSTPYATVDISPMDMAYFPNDYPKLKMSKQTDMAPLARIIYSRPHLQGRRLFPDILKYGEPWRLGANESTELQLFKDATIQNRKIPAGRYILYCIPQENFWTVVFNSNIDSWGLHADSTRDIARFEAPVKKLSQRLEYFSLSFVKTDNGAEMLMAWDDTEARLPIVF